MKAKEFLDEIGPQFRSQIKDPDGHGSRHIRHIVEYANKKIDEMLDYDNEFPCPFADRDALMLRYGQRFLTNAIEKLREVRDKK